MDYSKLNKDELVKILQKQDEVIAAKYQNYRLDSNTEKFSGKPKEDLENWFVKIERSFKTAAVPETLQINVASPYITGGASLFLTMLEKEYDSNSATFTWDDLKKSGRQKKKSA